MVKIKELAEDIYLLLESHTNRANDRFSKGETLVKFNNEQLARVGALPGHSAILFSDCEVVQS